MQQIPTIHIAMFGSRSTGKTTFLSSFVSPSNVKGCSLAISDDETKAYLNRNWQQLMQGEVPGATAMMIKDKLRFTLRYANQGGGKDEDVWHIQINDYPGRLVEWDDPTQEATWEERNRDELSEEFKAQLHKHIQGAHAILFLVPVDIDEWKTSEQKLYMAYINDIIETAKQTRGNYTTSIPFCIALMKWDMTDIEIPQEGITSKANAVMHPQVEKFMKSHPIFQKIYDLIQSASREDTAVFAASAFGSHSAHDKTKPDPGNLEPFNVIPILYWLCRQAEASNIRIAEREVERIRNQAEEMSDQDYQKLQSVWENLLETGINSTVKRTEVAKLAEENRKEHIEFMEEALVKEMELIDTKRYWNKPAEKLKLLQSIYDRKLFRPENEVDLQHDIRDMKKNAMKRTQLIFAWQISVALALGGVILIVLWIYQIMEAHASFMQGESLIAKQPANLTAHDFESAEEYFELNNVFLENYIFLTAGRREMFRAKMESFNQEKAELLKEELAQLAITDDLPLPEKVRLCQEQAETIQKYQTLMTSEYFAKHFDSAIQKAKKAQEFWENEYTLPTNLEEIKNAQLHDVLALIENFGQGIKRTEYPEIFAEFDLIRNEKIALIKDSFTQEFAAVQDNLADPLDFQKRKELAEARKSVCEKYVSYFPNLEKYAHEHQMCENGKIHAEELIAICEKHILMKKDYDAIMALEGNLDEQLPKSLLFTKTYTTAEYPYGAVMYTEICRKLPEGKKSLEVEWEEKLAQYADIHSTELSVRIENANQRVKILNDFAEKLSTVGLPAEEVKQRIDSENAFLEKLGAWNKFMEAYQAMNLQEKGDAAAMTTWIDAIESFQMEYQKKPYNEFERYDEIINGLNKKLSDLKLEISILDIQSSVNEIKDEVAQNTTNFENSYRTLSAKLEELSTAPSDSRAQEARNQLQEMLNTNNENWENSEWEKVRSQMDAFDTTWDRAELDILFETLDSYLNNPYSPKKRSAKIQELKSYYSSFKREHTFRVTGHVEFGPHASKARGACYISINGAAPVRSPVTFVKNGKNNLRTATFTAKPTDSVQVFLRTTREGSKRGHWYTLGIPVAESDTIFWEGLQTVNLKQWHDSGFNADIFRLKFESTLPQKPSL